MTRKLFFLCSAVFVLILVGCGPTLSEPDINRIQALGNERDTYMSRAVWFPATYLKDGKRESTENLDLEALFQRANDWVEENEDRISTFSVTVVNATEFMARSEHSSQMIPSGILIVYTRR